ncbi:MAG: cell division protein ZapA [Geobacter sp.]|nr:cell division protein ZapA [Geobacter sp.]
METVHSVKVLGRELKIRSAASDEVVREVENFLNDKVADVERALKGGDTMSVAILTLLNIAESYLSLRRSLTESQGQDQRLAELIQRLDAIG